MNVFVPYSSPLDCAKALWNDSKRYNRQINIFNKIFFIC